ncbi:MAG: NUDIX hydrolase [Nocardioides sp.]
MTEAHPHPDPPQVQRLAAYAVIVRDQEILLSRLAPHISIPECWTLPGGGVDHGEPPQDAVVREVWEETGLRAVVDDTARVYSGHLPGAWRDGRWIDAHSVRIVYTGRVPLDSPDPRVVEVDGSTMAAAWLPIEAVQSGAIPVVPMVTEALADIHPPRWQRIAAYAVIRRGSEVLLTRLAANAPHAGRWTLPGGGVDHGEAPAAAVVREVAEECGAQCVVGDLMGVHDTHFTGTSPDGHTQDYHGIHLIYAASLVGDPELAVADVHGTTDAVAWHRVDQVLSGSLDVLDLVQFALR